MEILTDTADARHLRKYRLRYAAVTSAAISPPIVCACLASHLGDWEWFERSGALTTAIGLLVASRRHLRHGVLELAWRQTQRIETISIDVLEDILHAKVGLALSAFGTVIWGWGKYIGWWAFSGLVVWGLLVVRDARHDLARERRNRSTPEYKLDCAP